VPPATTGDRFAGSKGEDQMSAQIETRPNALVGRTMMAAALAGLIGVAITLAVAATLLLGRGGTTAPAVAPGISLEPGYVDFGQRHRAVTLPLEPGYVDFGQRHRTVSVPLEPGYVDFGQRHRAIAWPLEPGYVDYGQRHRDQP
jgi:hypothetical protein